METHGSTFLQQILDLKHQIDHTNEEIDGKIRRTRELDSAIVRCSEKEQAAVSDLEKWEQILSRRESQHSDLSAVTAVTQENVAELEAKLLLIENRRDELCLQIKNERNAFIVCCKSFQQNQEMADRAGDAFDLIPLKTKLLCEVDSLKKDMKNVRFADEALSQSKIERFRQLQNVNAELQNEIDADNVQNEHLLRKIEGLNDALVNVPGCQDISRLEEDFDIFSEEKRNLEDGIVTLQQQLPLLLSQEQKLGNLLRDQQRTLQSLEQKIEEVKLLQEAYENDFQNNLKDQNFTRDEDVVGPTSRSETVHETWDTYQSQKRHRLN